MKCVATATGGSGGTGGTGGLNINANLEDVLGYSIVGNQLSEILQSGGQSLTTVLNTTLLKREEEETRTFADEYVILFPREDEIQSKKLETQKEHTVDGVTMTAQEYYATVGGEKVKENERMDFEAWFEDTLGVSVKRSNISEAVKVQALQQEKLNDIATQQGELNLNVPMLLIHARKN